jgi:antitoxin component of RelBE/YafQ-DinJ toxin-antitoxin module
MVERQRARVLNVRIDDNEDRMMRALAEQQGLSVSDLIRQLVRHAFAEAFPPRGPKRK